MSGNFDSANSDGSTEASDDLREHAHSSLGPPEAKPPAKRKRWLSRGTWSMLLTGGVPVLVVGIAGYAFTYLNNKEQLKAEAERARIQTQQAIDDIRRSSYGDFIVAANTLERAVDSTLDNFKYTIREGNGPHDVGNLLGITLPGYYVAYQNFASADAIVELMADDPAVEIVRAKLSNTHANILVLVETLHKKFGNFSGENDLQKSIAHLSQALRERDRGMVGRFVSAAKHDLGYEANR